MSINESRPSGIARNAAANWLAFLFVAGVSFSLSPFIVRHLGNSAYGVWSVLAALVGYLGLLDFGVRGAVTRYVAHHHAAGDNDGCSSIVSAGMVLFGFLGTIAILLSCVFAMMAPTLLRIPNSLITDTQVVLILGGLTIATTFVGAVFGGVVTGLERFDVSSGVEIVITSLRAVATVIALQNGYGLVALGGIHLMVSIVYGLAMWICAHKLYPERQLQFQIPLQSHIRTILSFSMFLSAIHILGVVIYYSDVIVIGAFLAIGAVTYFVIAGNLCDYASKVGGAVSKMMTPRVSALSSVGSGRMGNGR